ncbi:MAG: hypothetical protein KDB21_01385 [Acidimicrobiales bacterium]|nr:hypothetical protein [Acidimicrobiales bacterium]
MTPSTLRSVHRWFTLAFCLLVLVQAVLAGRHLYDGADIDLHGYVGNATFLVGVFTAVAAWRGRLERRLLMIAVALVVLSFAQTGLGYSGRDSAEAAALHIPLGVLTFGVAGAQAALAWLVTPDPRTPGG